MPQFVKNGKFDKQAYNKWYYETHKRESITWPGKNGKTGPRPVEGRSDQQIMAEYYNNEPYYFDKYIKRQWAVSPKANKKTPGYYDVGAYIDNNAEMYTREHNRNFRNYLKTAVKSGMSIEDAVKLQKQYNRNQSYAQNEQAKMLQQYQKDADTYTMKNKVKLTKAKIRNTARKAVKSYISNYNLGLNQIISTAKKGLDYIKYAESLVKGL